MCRVCGNQLQMAENVPTLPEPTVWVRHFNFLDFESFGLAAPTWINLVRDPVSLIHKTVKMSNLVDLLVLLDTY